MTSDFESQVRDWEARNKQEFRRKVITLALIGVLVFSITFVAWRAYAVTSPNYVSVETHGVTRDGVTAYMQSNVRFQYDWEFFDLTGSGYNSAANNIVRIVNDKSINLLKIESAESLVADIHETGLVSGNEVELTQLVKKQIQLEGLDEVTVNKIRIVAYSFSDE